MHNIKTLCFCNFSSASVSNCACLQRDIFVPTVYIHILSSLRIHKQKSEENNEVMNFNITSLYVKLLRCEMH